jgi:hypothetical protein
MNYTRDYYGLPSFNIRDAYKVADHLTSNFFKNGGK